MISFAHQQRLWCVFSGDEIDGWQQPIKSFEGHHLDARTPCILNLFRMYFMFFCVSQDNARHFTSVENVKSLETHSRMRSIRHNEKIVFLWRPCAKKSPTNNDRFAYNTYAAAAAAATAQIQNNITFRLSVHLWIHSSLYDDFSFPHWSSLTIGVAVQRLHDRRTIVRSTNIQLHATKSFDRIVDTDKYNGIIRLGLRQQQRSWTLWPSTTWW